jgi:hypothetical protein
VVLTCKAVVGAEQRDAAHSFDLLTAVVYFAASVSGTHWQRLER